MIGTVHIYERTGLLHPVHVGAMRRAMHRYADHFGQKRPRDPGSITGVEREGWEEIESACAENAAAIVISHNWPGDWWSKEKTIDIPPDIEVRWTRYSTGHLFLYPKDDPDLRYILVTGQLPRYEVCGWQWGSEGKHERYWGKFDPDRPECYMVPQSDLLPLSELGAPR